MSIRHLLAAGASAVLLAVPATAAAAPAEASTASAPRAAGSPTATVNSFAKAIEKAKGKAACALMTKGYQRKVVKVATAAGAPAGTTCTTVMTTLGEQVKANGGIPAYKLKIEKRTKNSAVVRMTFTQENVSGTYTTKLIGGKWLIGASTVTNV